MSRLDDLASLLRDMEAFRRIPQERLKLIAYKASSADLKTGQAVLRAGEPSDKVVILTEGVMETRDDRPPIRFEPGTMIGEIGVLMGAPASTTVVAVTDARASILTGAQFEELLEHLPEFKTGLLMDFAQRLARG